jgi:hypothetical protein
MSEMEYHQLHQFILDLDNVYHFQVHYLQVLLALHLQVLLLVIREFYNLLDLHLQVLLLPQDLQPHHPHPQDMLVHHPQLQDIKAQLLQAQDLIVQHLQTQDLQPHHPHPQDMLVHHPQPQDIKVQLLQAQDLIVQHLLIVFHLLLIHTLSVLHSLLLTAHQLLATGDQIHNAQLLLQLCQRISAHLIKQLHTGILKNANGHAHQLDTANGMYQQELYHHMIMIHASNLLIQLLALKIHNAHGKITLLHQLSTQLHSAIHLWNLEPLT